MIEMQAQPIGKPNYCTECASSLVQLKGLCTSKDCEKCGKTKYYLNRTSEGIRIEEGERVHLTHITMSLDPKGNKFSRIGFERFIKSIFLEEIPSHEEYIDSLKVLEAALDERLIKGGLLADCDLDNPNGVDEALKIFEENGMNEERFTLLRSTSLNHCYKSIKENNAHDAAYGSSKAENYKILAMLEHSHLKEILWLGYCCYHDLVNNNDATIESVKEFKLIEAAKPIIATLPDNVLHAYVNDSEEISPRLKLQGLPESTIKSLLEYEAKKRCDERDEKYKNWELRLKERETELKEEDIEIKWTKARLTGYSILIGLISFVLGFLAK